jgi:uncharacterized protein (TIGR00725 family)
MEAASRAATDTNGRTIGSLPGPDLRAANPHLAIAIATGLGHGRNVLVVMNGDAVIAIHGGPR